MLKLGSARLPGQKAWLGSACQKQALGQHYLKDTIHIYLESEFQGKPQATPILPHKEA